MQTRTYPIIDPDFDSFDDTKLSDLLDTLPTDWDGPEYAFTLPGE